MFGSVGGQKKLTAHVDELFIRVRWVLLLFVLPVAWIESPGNFSSLAFWSWVGIVAVFNLALEVASRFGRISPAPKWLRVATLVFDVLFFGFVSHINETGSNLLALFSIFPALVGAIRFGPQVGLIITGLLALPIEIRALFPAVSQGNVAALSAGMPVIALLAVTAMLVGYLSQREKEAAIGTAREELQDLRHTIETAKLLSLSTDNLATTTSYAPLMESMLEAGVRGLPEGRMDDSRPVAVALFFESEGSERKLRVYSSRQLDRRDVEVRIPGKTGVIADALREGAPAIVKDVSVDSELSALTAFRRCRTGVCFPLQAGLEQYGVVVFAGGTPRPPSAQYLDLMRGFTNQAAFAFQNAKLYQNLRAEHDNIIRNDSEARQKLVRDLHDGPTQKVSALVMQFEYISRILDKNPAEAKEELSKARVVAEQAVKELRTALFSLRPLTLETKGLSAALSQLAERLEKNEKISIRMEPGNFGAELDPNIAATTFAIVEEAINNARKHARGAPIFVTVGKRENTLVATVQDQGAGFDVDKVSRSYSDRASFGLQNMRERARLIDGELRIESTPGRGTVIHLIVLLPTKK